MLFHGLPEKATVSDFPPLFHEKLQVKNMDGNLTTRADNNDPIGTNTFFQSFRPQSPPVQAGILQGPSFINHDKPAKRRSVFTVSTVLPTTVTESSSQTLMNLVSEVSTLASAEGMKNQDVNLGPTSETYPESSDQYKTGEASAYSSDQSACVLTPPTTPTRSSDSNNESNGNVAKKHRHNSLENIHRPKNHRSSAKSSKSRQKRSKNNNSVNEKKYVVHSEHQCYVEIKSSEKWVLADGRKTALACKAATAFAMGTVRKLKSEVEILKEDNLKKRTEAAARLILHTMLLNSWRKCRKLNDKLQKENSLHLRSIENMCLQLRVIRQMHREEKEKSQRRSLEVSSMSIQIEEMKRERDNIQSELERVENELNNCQVSMETLTNKNVELVQTKLELQRALVSMEEEKEEGLKKTARVEMDNIRCQEMLQDMRRQINEESKLRLKWQEDARRKESEVIALKSDVDIRDKNLEQVQRSYQELKREVEQYKEATERVQKDEEKLKVQLKRATEEVLNLTKKLEHMESAIKERENMVEKMRLLAAENEGAILEVKENLSLFLGDGVIKRRRWANAFHYLVFPLDIFRAIFDMPRDHARSYMVDLKEVNA